MAKRRNGDSGGKTPPGSEGAAEGASEADGAAPPEQVRGKRAEESADRREAGASAGRSAGDSSGSADEGVEPGSAVALAPAGAPAAGARRVRVRRGDRVQAAYVVERRSGFLGRWLRRLLGLLILLLLLGVLIFAGVTFLLQSDIPRSMAQRIASRQLGLDVGLDALDVGWSGATTIRDVVVRVPEEHENGQVLARVPRIDVQLSPLPLLALQALVGEPDVHSLTVHEPTIVLEQGIDGRWNFQRAGELLALFRGDAEEDRDRAPELPELPALRVHNGTVVIRDRHDREATLEGLEVRGDPRSPLVYNVSAEAPWLGEVQGTLWPRASLRHEVRAELTGLDHLAERLEGILPLPAAVASIEWRGRLDGSDVVGDLNVRRLEVTDAVAAGEFRVEVRNGRGRVQVRRASAWDLPGVEGTVQVMTGQLIADSQRVQVSDVTLRLLGGQAVLRDLSYRFDEETGRVALAFRDLQPGDSRISGQVSGELIYGRFGEPLPTLQAMVGGEVEGHTFDRLEVHLSGTGAGYRDFLTMDLRLHVPATSVLLSGEDEPRRLSSANAMLRLRLAEMRRFVELTELRADDGPGSLHVWGRYFLDELGVGRRGDYVVEATVRGWPTRIPRLGDAVPVDLEAVLHGRIDPWGEGERFWGEDRVLEPVQIVRLEGEAARISVVGRGSYVLVTEEGAVEPPLWLEVEIAHDSRPQIAEIRAIERRLQAEAERGVREERWIPEEPPFTGRIWARLEVAGHPVERRLWGAGLLLTDNLVIGDYVIGDISAPLDAELEEGMLWVDVLEASLLEARVTLLGEIPLDEDQPGGMEMEIRHLDLDRVAAALDAPTLMGMLNGRLEASLRGLSLDGIRAEGHFEVEGLAVEQLVLAERAVIRPHLRGSLARVDVTLQQLMEEAPGPLRVGETRSLDLRLEGDITRPDTVVVRAMSEGYPLAPTWALVPGREHLDVVVSLATQRLEVSLGEEIPRLSGRLDINVQAYAGAHLAEMSEILRGRVDISADGQVLEVPQIIAQVGDVGEVEGAGRLDLRDLVGETSFYLHGRHIDLERLGEELHLPEGAGGFADFSLTLARTPGPRPRGDLMLNLGYTTQDAHFRGIELGQGQVITYLSRVPLADGTDPGMLDFNLISTERIRLNVAGGTVSLYGRYRDRGPQQGGRMVQVSMDAWNLDLHQLSVFMENRSRGRVFLNLAGAGSLDLRPRRPGEPGGDRRFPISGEGTLDVRNAELARFNLFRRLLQLARVVPGSPADTLSVDLRLEQGDLYFTNATAFVDGVQIEGAGRVIDVFAGGEGFVDANAAIFWSPLAGAPLPLMRQLDEILGALQTFGTGARIRGPIENPVVVPVALEEVGEVLRALIGRSGRG